ncbi:MAG: prepilin-type N-terminal cleavage/methylation domain-containing protein [candidate division NC10 bacterium]|nr:prepilin-type N-terminal cleavage/methylation domain-containing protein [candidate division NC10 bacterium]MDE2320892.1 prepilin-type N-terminal cleavage/methylation domain-containing protein [candidate division NC10 bacterium]
MQKERCLAQTAGSELRRARYAAPRATHGFTLLELLISMTILALIFVAVLGAVQIGIKSWEAGEARAEENQRNRTLVDTLVRDLAMIYPLRVKDQDKDVVVFHGKSDALEFATLPQIYGAEPFSHMIRIVTYAVEPDRGLVATASYPLAASASIPIEDQAKPLDERVSLARFRYLVPEGKPEEKLPPVWRDSWDPSRDETLQPAFRGSAIFSPGQRGLKGSDRLPVAVEITLTIRQTRSQEGRELILPPLVFPVQVGRTL